MPSTFRTPTLAEVIRIAMERRLMDVYVSMPAQVVTYNPATQTATVQPLLRKLGPSPTGTDLINPLPPIQNVPVCMFGSGIWRITVPVNAGDFVLLVWSDRSLDNWKGLKPAQYNPDPPTGTHTIDPQANNLHHLADAVAIVGIVPPSAASAATQMDRISIGSDGGPVVEILNNQVFVTAPTVTIQGGTANIETAAGATVNIGTGSGSSVTIGGAEASVTLGAGASLVARAGDPIVGTAGPFPVSAVIGVPIGNTNVKA